ncbi:hypothetical protein I5F07_12485 [Proteus vulgaris]|jgi:hypothetical protein|uniref:Uncharacterized protein n=1 Tax=Proteus vulgaris TaxID=585 RepID=A0A379F9Y5_PROVU|nr:MULTISPECIES: hypothetical protein [Proteus]NBN59128.1 hypothetical protein [Proteus sp. G2639]AYY82081.1 hypothetical protein EGX81_14865 [Proteus vulgaris]MBG5970256.1 hypothetical protein [Proteus vulgaris]MBG5985675.1 hypothetical protein [Proteus vulgaris]MBI6511609.1 hypothetical protein [Proteus sp. PR00174]
MKIDTLAPHALYISQPDLSTSKNLTDQTLDPLMATLNPAFYQTLTTSKINTVQDIFTLLNQFDVKNEGNQTVKEKRQVALLIYARQVSELENYDSKDVINQALVSLLSYQGFYHQFTLDLLGMTDNQDDYEGFFKPDSASFSF